MINVAVSANRTRLVAGDLLLVVVFIVGCVLFIVMWIVFRMWKANENVVLISLLMVMHECVRVKEFSFGVFEAINVGD
jgi:hypothetical protein